MTGLKRAAPKLTCLALILFFNWMAFDGFFSIRLQDGRLFGSLIDVLNRGVRLAPNPAAFHNRIGVILAMRKREFDRAASEIQKAISLEPDNPHYRSNLGKVMQKANKRRVG